MFGKAFRAVQDPKWATWGKASDVVWNRANTVAGQTVNQDTALQILTVYGCTSLITETISTLPIDVYREDANGSTEIATPRWLTRPNPEADTITWIAQIVYSLLFDGNAFVVPIRGPGGGVVQAWVLDPRRVHVERLREGGDLLYTVDGKPFTGELLHVLGAIPRPGQLRGLSPIDAAREALALDAAALEHGATFFGNGATVTGVIEVPGELTETRAKELKLNWVRHHGGRNAHTPGVLTGGATWKQMQLTQEQSQFLETRHFSAAQIAANIFHVEPSWVGVALQGSSHTYQNLEDRWINLARMALLPWIRRVEGVLYALLPRPQYARLCLDGLLRPDTLVRYQAHQIALTAGFMTVNEVRDIEDLPPLPGGDTLPQPAPETAPTPDTPVMPDMPDPGGAGD